ncbi:MAG: hypothetical protein ACOC9C_03390 [Chloroflexota bacterium]
MITWKDYYVERQRRHDEMESVRRHRAAAEREHWSPLGSGRTAFLGALLARLIASLRRQAGLHGS